MADRRVWIDGIGYKLQVDGKLHVANNLGKGVFLIDTEEDVISVDAMGYANLLPGRTYRTVKKQSLSPGLKKESRSERKVSQSDAPSGSERPGNHFRNSSTGSTDYDRETTTSDEGYLDPAPKLKQDRDPKAKQDYDFVSRSASLPLSFSNSPSLERVGQEKISRSQSNFKLRAVLLSETNLLVPDSKTQERISQETAINGDNEKQERGEKQEKWSHEKREKHAKHKREKSKSEKSEKLEKIEKPEKSEKTEKTEKPEKAEKSEKSERHEKHKREKCQIQIPQSKSKSPIPSPRSPTSPMTPISPMSPMNLNHSSSFLLVQDSNFNNPNGTTTFTKGHSKKKSKSHDLIAEENS